MAQLDPPQLQGTSNPKLSKKGWLAPLRQFTENKLVVLALLFFVTAVLGIPLLWISSKFSNLERWFWAIVVTVYTAVLLWLVFKLWMSVISQFQSLM
jgi:hypothetical protein